MSLLAEAIFAYIDELSADSVEGYAEAQAEIEDLRRHRRHELAALLVRKPPAAEADLRAAGQAAGWRLPRTVAALACGEGDLSALSRRLPFDSLAALLDDTGCVLVPDPNGPGREESLGRAAAGLRVALGPIGERSELAASWSLACAALRASEVGGLKAAGLIRVEDHLGDLLLFEGGPLVRESQHAGSRRLSR